MLYKISYSNDARKWRVTDEEGKKTLLDEIEINAPSIAPQADPSEKHQELFVEGIFDVEIHGEKLAGAITGGLYLNTEDSYPEPPDSVARKDQILGATVS